MADFVGDDEAFAPVETLSDRAYRALEEEIVTLRIPPGTVVSEAILSRRLGLGRTPVREALQRLAREGLVMILARRGIVVSDIDPVRQLRLLEARREIERLLARCAARRATAGHRDQFREIVAGMDLAGTHNDDIAFMRLDRRFNALVLEAAENEFAASAMNLMNGLSRRFWYMHYRQAADLPLAARLHAAIAHCIAEGDATAAADRSDALLDYIEAFARKTIG